MMRSYFFGLDGNNESNFVVKLLAFLSLVVSLVISVLYPDVLSIYARLPGDDSLGKRDPSRYR